MVFWQKKWIVIFFVLGPLPLFLSLAAEQKKAQVPSNMKDKDKDKDKEKMAASSGAEKMDTIERKKQEPRISNKWFRGNYLIYDCTRGNFVCVNSQSFERCEKEREEDKKNVIPSLRCTPFKMFKSQKECFKEQYRQIENQKPKVYCQNPKYY